MKKQTTISFLAAVACILLFSAGCNSQDPVSYNNKIMYVMNASTDDMDAMNAAMEKEDYTTAETVRKTWEEKLVKSAEAIKGIGDFKGDSNFKNACVKAIDSYKTSVSVDYKELIALRESQKNGGKADENKINDILNKINQSFEKAATDLNAASDKFEKDFAK